jgi:hypothetical protein
MRRKICIKKYKPTPLYIFMPLPRKKTTANPIGNVQIGVRMHHSHRYSTSVLTILGALTVLGPTVRAASIGVHSFHSHHHNIHASQSSLLPVLHEPVPSNVPSLSNSALIRLWEHNQFSPILRDPGIEKQLFAAVSAERSLNPSRFDRLHPVVGHLIRDPAYFNAVLNAYLTHTARFVRYHHQLLPFLRGGAMTMISPPPISTPIVQGTSPEQIVAPGMPRVNPIPEGINNGPGPTTPTTPTGPSSVPAPPSIVLMILGMSYVASRIRFRRPMAAH